MKTVKKSSLAIPLLIILALVIGGVFVLYGGTSGLQGNIGIRTPLSSTPTTTPAKVRAPVVTADFSCKVRQGSHGESYVTFTDYSTSERPITNIKVRNPNPSAPAIDATPRTIENQTLVYLNGDSHLITYEVSDGMNSNSYSALFDKICDGSKVRSGR